MSNEGSYLEIKDKTGATLYTHSSWIPDELAPRLKEVRNKADFWRNLCTGGVTWLALELVNRLKQLKGLRLEFRFGIVALPAFVALFTVPRLYWGIKGNREVRKLCDGCPVWTQKYKVLELDKLFYQLDDDNNFEPSLAHHGVSTVAKPERIYKYEEY